MQISCNQAKRVHEFPRASCLFHHPIDPPCFAKARIHMIPMFNRVHPGAVRRSLTNGFTLIEVMIVVAIVAILATIAIPSYQDYILRGKLVDATTMLRAKRTDLERYFQDNRTYVGYVCADTTTSKYFDFSCAAAPTANAYRIQADGKAGSQTAAFTFLVDQTGAESTPRADTAHGWSQSENGFCVAKGQPC